MPERCPVCGCSKFLFVINNLETETHDKAVDFFKKHIRNGRAWFELKKIGNGYYLYGRMRSGNIKKSCYIGKIGSLENQT